MAKVLVVYSGGMDSFTLLNMMVKNFGEHNVRAISFDYGQRHRKELNCALEVCKSLNVMHHIYQIADMFPSGTNALTNPAVPVPEGHYEAESMKNTVVPGRNLLMLTLAYMRACALGCGTVAYGAHAGDHAIYPDCRPEFIKTVKHLFQTTDNINLYAPFMNNTKADILRQGLAAKLDYANTWTCYKGNTWACGKCGSCTERLEAFAKNNATDPLHYE